MQPSKIKTLIIDDEYLARQVIRDFLNEDESIQVVGECDNGFEGFKLINEHQPDLIFLDVMMPKLTGFEMLELVAHPPTIIFSTAFDEYAIQAFEQHAVDYLLKPYSKERFHSSLAKAKEKIQLKTPVQPEFVQLVAQQPSSGEVLTRVAVRTGNKINIVAVDSIRFIEAQDDYVKFYAKEGNFLKQQTMKYYEEHLPVHDFVRIHRSYIVKVKAIDRVEKMGKDSHVVLLQDGTQLAVSRSGYARLKEVLAF